MLCLLKQLTKKTKELTMNAMNAINAINDQKNNATTCNQQPNGGGKVTPAHYEELEELQLESVAAGGKEEGMGEGGKEKHASRNKRRDKDG